LLILGKTGDRRNIRRFSTDKWV